MNEWKEGRTRARIALTKLYVVGKRKSSEIEARECGARRCFEMEMYEDW